MIKNKPKSTDVDYMNQCIDLAKLGQYTARPNPLVGCVIVKEERVIAKGYHRKAGGPHAEVHAIQSAFESVQGATAYVSLEPCAHTGRTGPCARALIDAQIKKCVIGMLDPNPQVQGRGVQMLMDAGIEVEVGVCEPQAQSLNEGFITRMTLNRPKVVLKSAISLDGAMMMNSKESQWITSTEARIQGQHLRAHAGAILTSDETLVRDQAQMNVRIDMPNDFEQPLRVILSPSLSLPDSCKAFDIESPILILTSPHASDETIHAFEQQTPDWVRVQKVAGDERTLDLEPILGLLGELEINDVLVEAGPTLLTSFIQTQCFDELVAFVAPKLLGSQTIGLYQAPNQTLAEHSGLVFKDVKTCGPDIMIRALRSTHA